MSNYTKSTNFATKDNLTPGDPLKIVRGTEIDTEYNNIATAIATKTDNASAAITGGTINATTIGATTASTGAFSTLSATGAITSTLATGTAPLVIASTTKVANLNVDSLDGADWASPAALGSTTPAAVSATTLTTSSTVTFNGGTANGVTYLNGSKVVTSGSALTFDGTNLATTGRFSSSGSGVPTIYANQTYGTTGDSASAIRLNLNSGAGGGYLQGYSNDTWHSHNCEFISGSNWVARNTFSSRLEQNNGDFLWYINSGLTAGASFTPTEQMRLTSTGLGIGTSSPSQKLDVAGNITATAWIGRANGSAPSSDCAIYRAADNTLGFSTASTERARIDSSGNLIQTVNTTAATLTTNQTLTFSIVDNSTLRISVRGSDGTTRTATVALT